MPSFWRPNIPGTIHSASQDAMARKTRLIVDVEAGRAVADGREHEGKWVSFYATLALDLVRFGSGAPVLTVERLWELESWRRGNQRASVGKQVSRHVNAQPARARLVRPGEKVTQAWRLDCQRTCVALRPSIGAVSEWLDRQCVFDALCLSPSRLGELIDGTDALHSGEFSRAQEIATRSLETSDRSPADLELHPWRYLLLGQAAHRLEDRRAVERARKLVGASTDPTSRSVAQRLRAMCAMRRRFRHPEEARAELGRLLFEIDRSGDVAARACALNVLGLAVRRAGDPGDAARHFLRAAALFGIVGDMSGVQAAVFNLALCRVDVNRSPDAGAFALLDLCIRICARFRVGRDSAQAETTGAAWAARARDLERARKYLHKAHEIVRGLASEFEWGCFFRASARVHQVAGDVPAAMQALGEAQVRFDRAGDRTSAAAMAAARRELEAASR